MKYSNLLSFILLSLLCYACKPEATLQTIRTPWQFSEAKHNNWKPATVPGTIHTDLMANGIIPDPFYGGNEDSVQWVSLKDWEYKTIFKTDKHTLSREHVELVFNGLDTYADVYLNSHLILRADNMFRTWRVEVKKLLKVENELRVIFKSAEKHADSCAKAALPLVRPCENNRHYARKAQYNFGWDWAPKLITCGIWKPIQINAYNGLNPLDEYAPQAKNNVKFIQEEDSIGESFYFTVNGKPTYMKGANWIPADVFLPRVTKAKYRELLVAAKEAGFNMLRVWGGGIYESDDFYSLCDSLGVYVWQDMMFAGAMYPASDSTFIESVKNEIKDNVLRLRKHKCIVLWCGNNEIKEGWHNWGWNRQFRKKETYDKVYGEYLELFEKVIPEEIKKYDSRPYIPTSPLHYGYGHPESLTHGNSHYWGVWVMGEPIETYTKKIPRFASEFGMQAMPNMESVKKYAYQQDLHYTIPEDLIVRNPVLRAHQKHSAGFENIALYLKQNNYHPRTLQEYIDATQNVQSNALETAIQAQANSKGHCMGTLFWQFNDCWPVTSWSIIDYYGNKKKAYYTVKKLYINLPQNKYNEK